MEHEEGLRESPSTSTLLVSGLFSRLPRGELELIHLQEDPTDLALLRTSQEGRSNSLTAHRRCWAGLVLVALSVCRSMHCEAQLFPLPRTRLVQVGDSGRAC